MAIPLEQVDCRALAIVAGADRPTATAATVPEGSSPAAHSGLDTAAVALAVTVVLAAAVAVALALVAAVVATQ